MMLVAAALQNHDTYELSTARVAKKSAFSKLVALREAVANLYKQIQSGQQQNTHG